MTNKRCPIRSGMTLRNMIDYIKGTVAELTPTDLVLETGGIGYHILISLQTYELFQGKTEGKAFIHHYLREDDEQYYGFATKDERELFRLLISVTGIGAGTARMMLSSLTNDELRNAILGEDVKRIQSIKGIGAKSAQRVILELKDKIVKGAGADSGESTIFARADNAATVDEATTALVMLGFTKANIAKVMPVILKENPAAKVEEIIKAALQRL